MNNFYTQHKKLCTVLKTPAKIQDFLNSLPMRYDESGHIIYSPHCTLEKIQMSCMEGALFAYALLKHHGYKTFLLDLKVDPKNNHDVDHVMTLFKIGNKWGALSKTNHAVLRYREPIYNSPREIAISCFHEYFTHDGKKNLRSFSKPFDVDKHAPKDWVSTQDDLYELACTLNDSPHETIISPQDAKKLRKAENIEIAAGKIIEWDKNKKIF